MNIILRSPSKLLFISFISLFLKLNAQVNIVPNPGFELYSSCPTFGAQWNKCLSWNNVNMVTGVGLWGTPDYFTACGTGNTAPPSTFAGICTPHSGQGMMGAVWYNTSYSDYREYIAAPLICPMIPGNTYSVSFWITNGSSPKSPWTIRNIGVNFSASALTQTGFNIINLTPQYLISTNIATTSWQQITFTISPTAVWNHITIGNFSPDTSNNPTLSFPLIPGATENAYSYYFIDDIEVLKPTSGKHLSVSNVTLCTDISKTTTLHVNSSYTSTPLSYTWQPGNLQGQTVNVSPISNTIYSVTAATSSLCTYNTTLSVTLKNNCNSSPTESLTSMTKVKNTVSYTISPNPFSTEITVKSPEDSEIQQIRISDLSGKVLRSETVMHASATIDLSGLKPAVYFIEIETSSHLVIRKKLIKTP
jgi:hypothetical protein